VPKWFSEPLVLDDCTRNALILCFRIIVDRQNFSRKCMLPHTAATNEVATYPPPHRLLFSTIAFFYVLSKIFNFPPLLTPIGPQISHPLRDHNVQLLHHPDPTSVNTRADKTVDARNLLPSPLGSQSGVHGSLDDEIRVRPCMRSKVARPSFT
jgi:hypothetical protein